ncbi:hypothetical protein TOPH_07625 [Tolypocladium ophioglossoides CBS 100239]|uniref:Protein kinase domain-containing protein n=1 Tax=Tolypocladium ophioglossoides (strain CBS 100239) TaxID=1163406 RepID=A0A0L0N1V0_TOLOC|nr:hypothetical protein TOPH_07625 [Tolypocladium ophioglossoides CBS 100239]
MNCGGRFAGDPFGLWKPLPDPRRPDLPYHSGLDLCIRRHIPPPPFGSTGYYKGEERQESLPQPIRAVTQSEWCLQHPPADTPPHPDATVHNLRVIDQVACEDGRGAQVLRCCLDQDEARVYVAKIFDPLYYSYADRGFGTAVDVTWLADQQYSREAAGYEDLEKAGVDGVLVPKYYGSWTFDMPLLGSPVVMRPVRMVLMEWLQGVSMSSLIESNQVSRTPPVQRLNILAAAMEVECKIFFHGVRHGDFAPRNIMLVGSYMEAQAPRVFLVDLNNSSCLTRPRCRWKGIGATRPISPRYRFWRACDNEFLAWVPEPHRSRRQVFTGWLKVHWEHSKEFADRAELPYRFKDFDSPVEIVQPLPDTEPDPPLPTLPRRRLNTRRKVPGQP